jgi:type II secretory pathway component GspD/PulD (secretin)
VIKRTNDGRTEVLLAPTMLVHENTSASITVGDGDDQLTLELTARVIETGPETNQAEPRSAEKKSGVDSK